MQNKAETCKKKNKKCRKIKNKPEQFKDAELQEKNLLKNSGQLRKYEKCRFKITMGIFIFYSQYFPLAKNKLKFFYFLLIFLRIF